MEIQDLLGRLKGADKVKPKPFLALELTDEIAVAAVWQVVDGKTEVVSIGTPVEWDSDKAAVDELVKAVDATVSSATEGIEENIADIIFGVAPSWAGEEGITSDKLKMLKMICRELEFKPLGFVVVTDSLLRYLKMQEGVPATSILVQVARDTVTVSLVRVGKLVGSETMGRSDDIAADVEEGLSRLDTNEEFPSRILVYDGMHSLEEEVQNLISYDWKSKFNFLHIPKIESLPKDILIRSIAVAGGSEVAKAIGFEITEPVESPAPVPDPKPAQDNKPEPEIEIQNVVSVGHSVKAEVENELLSAEDFGFGLPDKKPRPESKSAAPAASKINLSEIADPEESIDGDALERSSEEEEEKPKLKLPKLSFPAVTLPSLPKLRLPGSRPRLPAISLGKPLMFGVLLVVLLLGGLAAAVWVLPQATVTIFVEPKDLEENTNVILSTSATSPDPSTGTVPAVPVETLVSGEESVTTTGQKTVGDPASGEITIYNRTSANKTFAKNTVLSAKSLKFSLTESVTVASKSAGADYVDVPGKATAKIAAKNIGEEGNLPAGTEFVIENFAKDSYVAKNDNALSGGSSKQIQVVDAKDQTALKGTLTGKLEEEGRSQLTMEQGEGKGVYIKTKASELKEADYSAKVGEEAAALTASFQLAVKGFSYSTRDVESLTASQIESSMPPDFRRTGDPPEVELGDVKSESDNSVEVAAKVRVKLLPIVEPSLVQKALRGVAAKDVESNLGMVVGFQKADVVIKPRWLPAFLKRMPRNQDHISISVVAAP